jgi:hypothetical protein
MSSLTALALVLAVVGGFFTWLFLATPSLLIWAFFIGMACFFHAGGDENALRNTIVGNALGCVLAWITATVILAVPLASTLTLPVWAGLAVGVAIVVIVLAANIKAFAVIPATVYGFASTFAFLLQTPDKLSLANLQSASLNNALIIVLLSLIAGAVLGFVSGKVAAMLTTKAA